MRQKVNIFSKTKLLLMAIVSAGMVASCVNDELFRDDLPDTNSKVDTIFPAANFSYAASSDDFRIINFTNLATEATVFEWDFGNGDTSNEENPVYTYVTPFSFEIILTATSTHGTSVSDITEINIFQ